MYGHSANLPPPPSPIFIGRNYAKIFLLIHFQDKRMEQDKIKRRKKYGRVYLG